MKKLLAVCALLLISACTTKTTHLSVVVPNDIQFTAQDLNRATVRKNVTAEDTNPIVLFFPIGFPKFSTAFEKALHEGNGDTMTNVTITDELRWFILFGWTKITVTGDVVNTHR